MADATFHRREAEDRYRTLLNDTQLREVIHIVSSRQWLTTDAVLEGLHVLCMHLNHTSPPGGTLYEVLDTFRWGTGDGKQTLHSVRRTECKTTKVIYVSAVCYGNNHWIAVILDYNVKVILVMDSLDGPRPNLIEVCLNSLPLADQI